MPQVMCPNCGKTITLENRRRIDFDLITSAVKQKPRNFTDLLKITKLSRKTLSLRLKEMCERGVLAKEEGKYNMNSAASSWKNAVRPGERFPRVFHDRRVGIGLIVTSLMLLSLMSGYTLAVFIERPKLPSTAPTPSPSPPVSPGIPSNLTMALDIHDVENVYAWQAVIIYNATELSVLKIVPGDFLGVERVSGNVTDYSRGYFVSKVWANESMVLLGGSLVGPSSGVNGTGRLATVSFTPYVDESDGPELVPSASVFETYLIDTHLNMIPITNSTLTLSRIEI